MMMEGRTIGDREGTGFKTFGFKTWDSWHLPVCKQPWAVHFSTLSGFTEVS